MEPQIKIYGLKDMALTETGTFRAIFSTLNVEDQQGDITLPGAFGEQKVLISQYNHGSWERGVAALPIGVGRIYEQGEEAIIEGEFDMDDPAAVSTYKKMKYIHSKGRVQEFSYALPEIDYEFREQNGHRVRVLKKIRVPEVSPVLMGAGIRTRLLDIKGGGKTVQPGENETEQDFVSRCVAFYVDEGREPEQAAAICHRIWREGKSSKLLDHVALVTEDVSALILRLSKVASLRESQGDSVGEATMQRVLGLRAKLSEMVTEVDRIAKEHTAVERATLETLEIINRYRR